MGSAIMYQEDGYVLLETDQPEQLLTADELLARLGAILEAENVDLPADALRIADPRERAIYVRDQYCELDLGPGRYCQWYVVRFEPTRR